MLGEEKKMCECNNPSCDKCYYVPPSNEQAFYMVLGGGAPTVRHSTLALAIAEACRLAKLHPDKKFYAMQAVEAVVASVPIVERRLLTKA